MWTEIASVVFVVALLVSVSLGIYFGLKPVANNTTPGKSPDTSAQARDSVDEPRSTRGFALVINWTSTSTPAVLGTIFRAWAGASATFSRVESKYPRMVIAVFDCDTYGETSLSRGIDDATRSEFSSWVRRNSVARTCAGPPFSVVSYLDAASVAVGDVFENAAIARTVWLFLTAEPFRFASVRQFEGMARVYTRDSPSATASNFLEMREWLSLGSGCGPPASRGFSFLVVFGSQSPSVWGVRYATNAEAKSKFTAFVLAFPSISCVLTDNDTLAYVENSNIDLLDMTKVRPLITAWIDRNTSAVDAKACFLAEHSVVMYYGSVAIGDTFATRESALAAYNSLLTHNRPTRMFEREVFTEESSRPENFTSQLTSTMVWSQVDGWVKYYCQS